MVLAAGLTLTTVQLPIDMEALAPPTPWPVSTAIAALAAGSVGAHLEYGVPGLARDVGGLVGVALVGSRVVDGEVEHGRGRVELEHQPGAGEVEEDQAGWVVRRRGWHADQVGVERARALEVLGPLGYLHELHAAIMAADGPVR